MTTTERILKKLELMDERLGDIVYYQNKILEAIKPALSSDRDLDRHIAETKLLSNRK